MRGVEDAESAQARYELFENLWQQREEILHVLDLLTPSRIFADFLYQDIIDHTNTEAVRSLKKFIDSTYDDE